MCVYVRYSSSSPGEGKGGSRYIIFRELYYPLQWGHGLGMPGPLDLGCPRAGLGLGWGEWEENAFFKKEDPDGVLGSGCLGLSILLLLSCAVLSFIFFFF